MLRRTKKRSELAEDGSGALPASNSTAKSRKRRAELDEKVEEQDVQLQGSRTRTRSKGQINREVAILGVISQTQDSEEALLEKYVLGGQHSFVENLKRGDNREVGVLDAEQRKPAWEDDDNEGIPSASQDASSKEATLPTNTGTLFSQRRKAQFEKVVGIAPSWAQLPSKRKANSLNAESEDDSEDEDDDKLLRRTGDYLTSSESLPKGSLNVRKVTNANKEQYTRGRLAAMEFHPTSQVILTAGEDQSLHIFQVDGKHNPKIQSVAVEGLPILGAHFSANGTEVIMSSRSRWFYVYDMIAGKMQRMSFLREYHERQPLCQFTVSPDGNFMAFQGQYGFIHLVTAKNKELVGSLKMNGSVASLAFSADGSKLFSFGDDGEVYVWNMKTRDCIHKFVDEGCIRGTRVSVSRNGNYVACGSHSGVVNVYDSSTCLAETRPKPLKAVMNLTTAVTATQFNGSSEILATASFHTKAGVKLIHLPDCHIFPNFPVSSDSIGLPTLLDFSPNSGYMAVGNGRGKALLYRLGHYKDY